MNVQPLAHRRYSINVRPFPFLLLIPARGLDVYILRVFKTQGDEAVTELQLQKVEVFTLSDQCPSASSAGWHNTQSNS